MDRISIVSSNQVLSNVYVNYLVYTCGELMKVAVVNKDGHVLKSLVSSLMI